MGRAGRILTLVLVIAMATSGTYLVLSHLPPGERVTIATFREPGSLAVWVAQDLGFYRARGLDARIIEFSGAGLSTHVLLGGGADVAGIPPVYALTLAMGGTPLKLVHTTADLRPGNSQLLVRADLSVEALEDLRGLRVGFEDLGPGCLPCVAFRRVLGDAGVEVIGVAVPDYKVQEAMAARVIDAAVVSQPFNTFVLQKGLAYALMDPRLGPAGDAAATTYGVTPREGGAKQWLAASAYWTTHAFLKAKPEVVRRIALAIADASSWLRNPANLPRTRDILIKYAGGLGTPEYFQAAATAATSTMVWRSYPSGYTDWQGLQHQADAFAALGILRRGLDVRPLVTMPWFDPSGSIPSVG